jgi:hypothetical protein
MRQCRDKALIRIIMLESGIRAGEVVAVEEARRLDLAEP